MLSEEQDAFHWDRPTSCKYLTFTMRQLIEKCWGVWSLSSLSMMSVRCPVNLIKLHEKGKGKVVTVLI
jgi:hypothetical protein